MALRGFNVINCGEAILYSLVLIWSTFILVEVLFAIFTTIANDFFINHTSYINLDNGIDIGIGQDTLVSVGNALGGLAPEANFDMWVSNNKLLYDNDRASGTSPRLQDSAYLFRIARMIYGVHYNIDKKEFIYYAGIACY